jgi:hypothetical protein
MLKKKSGITKINQVMEAIPKVQKVFKLHATTNYCTN